jgi:hypothetical protein
MKAILISLIVLMALPAAAQKASKDGRFQVLQISNMRRDQILIDTQTGKMWHYTCLVRDSSDASECASSAWMADEIEGITKSKKDIYKEAMELERIIKERKPSNQQAKQLSPVTRTAKDGTVYQQVGADEWAPMQSAPPPPQ